MMRHVIVFFLLVGCSTASKATQDKDYPDIFSEHEDMHNKKAYITIKPIDVHW